MAHVLCDSLLDNYRNAIAQVAEVTQQFNSEEWLKGINFFQVPAKIAFHIVDTLDYYFRENPSDQYKWGQGSVADGGHLPITPDRVKKRC